MCSHKHVYNVQKQRKFNEPKQKRNKEYLPNLLLSGREIYKLTVMTISLIILQKTHTTIQMKDQRLNSYLKKS